MLECIFNHAVKYKTLFFEEVMFITLAFHNNLNVKKIEELDTILWRKKWTKNELNINNLYHPVKSIEDQYEFRNYLRRLDHQ